MLKQYKRQLVFANQLQTMIKLPFNFSFFRFFHVFKIRNLTCLKLNYTPNLTIVKLGVSSSLRRRIHDSNSCVYCTSIRLHHTFGKLRVNQHRVPQLQLARPKLRLIQFQHNNLKKVKILIRILLFFLKKKKRIT